ncbi:MAG: hypothetical protein AAF763_05310 [Pseudomonadota bacterium]
MIGLFKTEVGKRLRPLRTLLYVDRGILCRVGWCNEHGLPSSIGRMLLAEAERRRFERGRPVTVFA